VVVDHCWKSLSDSASKAQAATERDFVGQGIRADYRKAFELFHRSQLEYQQIAEQLEVPLGTVKTWVHRARQEVVQKLAKREVVSVVSKS